MLTFRRSNPDGVMPNKTKVGFTLHCPRDTYVPRKKYAAIDLGVEFLPPPSDKIIVGDIRPLNELFINHGVYALNSLCDSKIVVVLINNSDTDYTVSRGEPIAHLILTESLVMPGSSSFVEA